MSQTSLTSWDYANVHVQQELAGGQFVSAETSLVAAGTPEIGGTSPYSEVPVSAVSQVYPIGLIENAGVSQSKQIQKVFEIGSSRSYFIPGRVIGSMQIGRMYYYGPSLLRLFYAYYYNDTNGILIGTNATGSTITLPDGSTALDPLSRLLNAGGTQFHNVQMDPGEDYLFINLMSDLFDQPFGMAFYFKDANFNSVGAFYCEDCYVQGHQFSISSGSVLVMESSGLQFDRIVPIQLISS